MSSQHETIGEALVILTEGLGPFVEKELIKQNGKHWKFKVQESYRSNRREIELPGDDKNWDAHALLMVMWDRWNICFRNSLGHQERSLVSELREFRNQWAHQKEFSFDDTYRILDSIERLLYAVNSDKASKIHSMKQSLLVSELGGVKQDASFEKKRNTYISIGLYLICAIAIITQLWISWQSRSFLMIGFVTFVFAFLITEQVRLLLRSNKKTTGSLS